eukprot:CAMPEP_0168547680 /NCGR_PEP_ID=MMETSP0413-20121227/4164_1 /TAXON_ID=136452 /ORGANISM="Filamoeba nolandi, Strain NC-AS-23-1" /LENGTH=427 /DNA_ID=CAMNT_0008577947 /DNA_START=5 /DNA_END=1284 /DNA_ORIENTATION=+
MIGDYLLQKLLGEGSYGTVKLAKHRPTDKKVAIKISSEDEIQREYSVLKTLHHVHIIQPIELVTVPPELRTNPKHERGMVLEYLDGGDLIDTIERHGRLSEEVALRYLGQLSLALSHCHKMGVAHRDVKPDNLLLDTKTGNMVLADFGLAAYCHPNQRMQGKVGSMLYAAPEVLKGLPYVGPEVDIWSAGVVFYCMLTGCIPWEGRDLDQQLLRAVTGSYYKVKTMSPVCADLVASMLSVNPQNRPTADDLLRRIYAALYPTHAPVATPTPTSTPQPKQPEQQEWEGELSDVGSCGSSDSEEEPQPPKTPSTPICTPSFHDDVRTITAKELKSTDYHLVYLDMEVLLRTLEFAFTSLSITTTRITKKKSWINSPCVKYACTYGQIQFEIEICKTRDHGSNTKVLVGHTVKGESSAVKSILALVYNKL